jgi:prepilin-type N-terminal cleavage/methylation domain-containing protein
VSYKKAFTMVELIVAMMIVAVLMSLGLFGISQLQIAGRNSQRQAKLAEMKAKIEDYYRVKGKFPGLDTNFNWASSTVLNIGDQVVTFDGPTKRATSGTTSRVEETYYYYSLERDGYRLCAKLESTTGVGWADFGTSSLRCSSL